MRITIGAAALLALAGPTPAAATDLPETPPPGVLSADAGIALIDEPVYAGARRRTTYVFPTAAFKYGTRLQGSVDDGVRWSAFDLAKSKVKAGPVIEYRQADRLQHATAFPGMRDAIEAGGFVEVDTPVADLEGRLRHSLTGYDGWSADLAADVGTTIGSLVRVGSEARLSWADYQYVRRAYGPDARGRRDPDGSFDRPSYFTAGGEADALVRIGPRLDLGGSVAIDRLLGGIAAPGIHRRRIEQVATTLTMHWGPRTQ